MKMYRLKIQRQSAMDIDDSSRYCTNYEKSQSGIIGYKVDNKRLIKAREEQNRLNIAMLQILANIQRKISPGHNFRNANRSKNNSRSHVLIRSRIIQQEPHKMERIGHLNHNPLILISHMVMKIHKQPQIFSQKAQKEETIQR